jgi:hypothetical protein
MIQATRKSAAELIIVKNIRAFTIDYVSNSVAASRLSFAFMNGMLDICGGIIFLKESTNCRAATP